MTDTSLEMVATQIEETPAIILPLTGTVVDLRQPREVARALSDIRDLKRQLDEVRGLLEGALRLEAQHQGTKTLHLGDLDAVISGGEKAEYDAEMLQDLLRIAGLPEDRLARTVVETVTYKVNQLVLRQLTAANRDYAAAAEAARTVVETPWRVTLKPTKGPL